MTYVLQVSFTLYYFDYVVDEFEMEVLIMLQLDSKDE